MNSPQRDGWLGPHRIHAVVDRCCSAHTPYQDISIPSVRDRVRIEGYDEVFFIVYVNVRRRIVDLVCGERVGFLVDVPFSSIQPAVRQRIAS